MFYSYACAEKAYHVRNKAEANWIAREQGYPGAGYNVGNAKLIEWLDITEDEQVRMQTIIGRNEKRKRNRRQAETYRRHKGAVSGDKYLEEAEKRRGEALRLRSEGFTQKQIDEALGIHQTSVSKMLKKGKLNI